MFKWFKDVFEKFKYRYIEYDVIEGGVVISNIDYLSPYNVKIPLRINGYPVTSILTFSFPYGALITKINGVKIENGFCVINNKWIYYWSTVHEIKYQIGSDYQFDGYHLINNILYSFHFK